ncbi:hypothetical protein BDY24DRAFT_402931 [Mrakia frigida]|uniref:uncharacterized protein n=1 Tax=Mrakia frigida TaxID=29902 RepID=UPI003FCC11C0
MALPKASFSSLAPEILDEIAFHVANRMGEDWILITEFSPTEISRPYKNLLSLCLVDKRCNASATPLLYKDISVSRRRSYFQSRSTLTHLFSTASSRRTLFQHTEVFHLELGSKNSPDQALRSLRLLKLMPNLRRVGIFPEVNADAILSSLHPCSRVLTLGILAPVDSALLLHGREKLRSLEEVELAITHHSSTRHRLPPPPPVQIRLPPSITSFKLTTDEGVGCDVRITLLRRYPNLKSVRISGTELVASHLEPFFDVQGETIKYLTLLGNDLSNSVRRDRTYEDECPDFGDPETLVSFHRVFRRLLPLVDLCPNLVTLQILDVHLPQVLALEHPTLQIIVLEPEDIIPHLRRILPPFNPCNHPTLRTNAISRLASALEQLLFDRRDEDSDDSEEDEMEEEKWRDYFPSLLYLEFNHVVSWSDLLEDQENAPDAMERLTEVVQYLGIDVFDDWVVPWSEEVMKKMLEKMEKKGKEEGGKKKDEAT